MISTLKIKNDTQTKSFNIKYRLILYKQIIYFTFYITSFQFEGVIIGLSSKVDYKESNIYINDINFHKSSLFSRVISIYKLKSMFSQIKTKYFHKKIYFFLKNIKTLLENPLIRLFNFFLKRKLLNYRAINTIGIGNTSIVYLILNLNIYSLFYHKTQRLDVLKLLLFKKILDQHSNLNREYTIGRHFSSFSSNFPFFHNRFKYNFLFKTPKLDNLYKTDDDLKGIIMSYSGSSLYDILISYTKPLSFKSIIMIIYQLTQRIMEFHNQGYIHLSIKPKNICIKNKKLYIIDYGRSIKIDSMTKESIFTYKLRDLRRIFILFYSLLTRNNFDYILDISFKEKDIEEMSKNYESSLLKHIFIYYLNLKNGNCKYIDYDYILSKLDYLYFLNFNQKMDFDWDFSEIINKQYVILQSNKNKKQVVIIKSLCIDILKYSLVYIFKYMIRLYFVLLSIMKSNN